MTATLIDGKKIAEAVLEKVKSRTAMLKVKPCLAIIVVGEDAASLLYTKKKHEACHKAGIISRNIKLPETTTNKELEAEIKKLNLDKEVDGILVQLPLPKHIDTDNVLQFISPKKDVDGLHPTNLGKMAMSTGEVLPCTPKGVIYLLKQIKVPLEGKHAVVLGRSRMVGKPLALLLLDENCTVTICHSKTENLQAITSEADILCSAVGKPKIITADMVKQGAVVVDIGTNHVDGKLVGDVDFEPVAKKASFITPVPGGVGPMTIAMLLENTLICHEQRKTEEQKKEQGKAGQRKQTEEEKQMEQKKETRQSDRVEK